MMDQIYQQIYGRSKQKKVTNNELKKFKINSYDKDKNDIFINDIYYKDIIISDNIDINKLGND